MSDFAEMLSDIEPKASAATDAGSMGYAQVLALLAIAEAAEGVRDELQNHRAAGWGQPA